MGAFVILIIILVVFWALFVLPRRRRHTAHVAMQDSLAVGDEIITAGGLHGRVHNLDGDTLDVEIAPETVVTLDRRAVAAVAREIEVERDADDAPPPDSGAESGPEPR